MQTISRDEARRRVLEGQRAKVVEVLDREQYRKFHLPGAINVPLDDDFDERIREAVPDKTQPVLVYCYDTECQASAKAAQRLEALGYEEIYDYEAGKVDWKEAGLPIES
ncbi:MAG: rhodanese-like domain-containing protein [Planctomycetales bacterium]